MSNSVASVKATLQIQAPPDMVMVVDSVTGVDLYQTSYLFLKKLKQRYLP